VNQKGELSVHKEAVERLLDPSSVAIVGISDRHTHMQSVIEETERAGVRYHFVNPRRPEVFGRPTVPSLREIGEPVDAVLAMVNAALSVDVVQDAVDTGAGGVVLTAAGFAETDDLGKSRQQQISSVAKAAGLAICGPNCNGLLNVAHGKSLYLGPVDRVRKGGVAVLSHSGGLLTHALSAGDDRLIGFSYLVATGNEAATDLVDYLDFLIDDPDTTTIAMVIEQVRRPQEFLDAAYRAREAGKPLVALKLGRSEIGKRTGASHTGALVGDPVEYEAAFRQVGILIANDFDDLFDQVQLFSSVRVDRWTDSQRVGVLTASGGDASLVSDTFEGEGIPLSPDPALTEWAHSIIPTNAPGNPLDVTGLLYNEEGFGQVLDRFVDSALYDTVLVVSTLGPTQEAFSSPLINPVRAAATKTDKRLILASTAAGSMGRWTEALIDSGIGVTRGIVPMARSLKAMDRFTRTRGRTRPELVEPIERPAHADLAVDGDQTLLTFSAAARLLERFDIPVAPYIVLDVEAADSDTALDRLPAAELYVVKAANVLHRTELGVVVQNVVRDDVLVKAKEVAVLAKAQGLSTDVVVQPQLKTRGEIFVGMQGASTFGPMVLFGVGGIFVEALHDVAARLAPLTRDDAVDMLTEISAKALLQGGRGRAPWDLDALADIIVNAGRLTAAATGWLDSFDLNPIMVLDHGFAAVDAACVVK
jgi:acetate---CoA ligase (ADP-forming)